MPSAPQTVAIIPARWGSTRFPGKPLVPIAGKPLIQWVVEAASRARRVQRVLVATDDPRIQAAVAGFGGQAVMTAQHHLSGSDRIAEAARSMDCEFVVNLQGDEPLIQPGAIDAAIEVLVNRSEVSVSTLKTPLRSEEEAHNPNVVKVVTDRLGRALYFSRAPIPFHREAWGGPAGPPAREAWRGMFRHLGLYVFRRDFLLEFTAMAPTFLEEREKLEQLRILENGHPIWVVETECDSPGVDCPEDLVQVEKRISQTVSS